MHVLAEVKGADYDVRVRLKWNQAVSRLEGKGGEICTGYGKWVIVGVRFRSFKKTTNLLWEVQ